MPSSTRSSHATNSLANKTLNPDGANSGSPTVQAGTGIALQPEARLGAPKGKEESDSEAALLQPMTDITRGEDNIKRADDLQQNSDKVITLPVNTESVTLRDTDCITPLAVAKSNPVLGGIWNQDLMFVHESQADDTDEFKENADNQMEKSNTVASTGSTKPIENQLRNGFFV